MWSFVFPHISGETILTLAVSLLCCQPPMQPGFPLCTFKRPVKSWIARSRVRRKCHETLECVVFPAKLAVPTPHHGCCVCLSSFILSLSQCVETFPSLLWGVTVFPKDNCDSKAARGAALSVRMKTNISQPWARCGSDPCDLPFLYTHAGCRAELAAWWVSWWRDGRERIDGLHVC